MDQQPTQSDLIAGLRRSATIIQSLKQEIADYHEPIAIIGMGCRFPGAANPDAFWELLRDGVDAITEVPAQRWPVDAFYAPTVTPGKISTRWGGFLPEVDRFDPLFFGISPAEAAYIDPQQRLLLETAWEALEQAGIAPNRLAGSPTGVFVGICGSEYAHLSPNQSERTHAYMGAGSALSITANRISYLLDLRGPSQAIDTACSSALVALHTACRSLRHGECQLALVAAVNLILTPDYTMIFSQAGMMAADGRCKTFDAQADGYVRSEGCGVVVLKRLSAAQQDGDTILAVIRGSAINQDGRTNGLTAPNSLAQQAVMKAALADAGVAANQVSYIETHGTGTALGDPIEVNAIKAVLLPDRPADTPCWLGSVKTNIGHLEAAAGIAGLIKVVLSLQHRELPRHLHLQTLNPHITLEHGALRIPNRHEPWLPIGSRRIAGVSSFGFGGANAHVILEEAPPPPPPQVTASDRPLHLLTISAKHPTALRQLTTLYAEQLATNPSALADFCFTANTGRSHFRHRLALTAASGQEAVAKLTAFHTATPVPGVQSGEAIPGKRPRLVFLFTGQGAQYVNMGRQLYETQPTFRATLDRCDAILQPILGASIIPLMYPEQAGGRDEEQTTSQIRKAKIDDTAYTQPLLFALEYALAELWRTWGVEPDVVAGHSLGEYVAACVAGVFTLEDGLKLVAERGRLMADLAQNGAMAAIFAPATQVATLIQPYSERLAIAALNGPANTVIAGEQTAVAAVLSVCEEQTIKARRLLVSHAFHSPLMKPMLAAFDRAAQQVSFLPPQIPLISNVTGQFFAPDTIPNAEYWRQHTLAPVNFAASIATLLAHEYTLFVEIGPKPVLGVLGQQINEVAQWLPSLTTDQADWEVLLNTLAILYTHGVACDWLGFDRDYPRCRAGLPTYPFQRQHYWIPESETSMIDQPPTSIQLHASARQQQLVQDVHLLLANIFKLEPTELSITATLLEVGADSLILTSAVHTLENRYGVNIGMRRLFEDLSTIEAIATYLDQVLPAETPLAAPTVVSGAPLPASPPQSPMMGASAWSNGTALTPTSLSSTGERVVHAAPVQPPDGVTSGIERVIRDQIQLMQQQLEILRGASQGGYLAPTPEQTPAPTTSVPYPPSANGRHPLEPNNEAYPSRITATHNGHPQVAAIPVAEAARPKDAPSNTIPTQSAPNSPSVPAPAPRVGPWGAIQTQKSQFTPSQQTHLDALIRRYTQRTQRSKQFTQEHRSVLADNRAVTGFRPSIKEMLYPIVAERSAGSHIWDLDGNEYVDIAMGFGVHFFGHQPAFILTAVQEQLHLGGQLGPQSYLAGRVAGLIAELTGVERVAFNNSGTEAVMTALRLARTATGRNKVAIFAGSYHGHSDGTLASAALDMRSGEAVPGAAGVTMAVVQDVLVLDGYGDPATLEVIKTHAHELAVVVVEPVQSRRPELQPREFLHQLRALTTALGIPLMFDEVITGFRIHPGGAQAHFGVQADLVTYGKVVGGGLPIGVVAGTAAIMDHLDGGMWRFGDDSYPRSTMTFFAGTFCKHPLTMASALAVLTQIKEQGPQLQAALNRRTAAFAETVNHFFAEQGAPIRVVFFGSLFYFRSQSNLDLFFYHLVEKGIYVWEGRTCFFSTAHSDADIEFVIEAIKATVIDLQSVGFLATPPIDGAITSGGQGIATAIVSASAPAVTTAPMTAAQKQLWFLGQLGDAAALAYNQFCAFRLQGVLHHPTLQQALQQIVARHEALRTTFDREGEQQQIHTVIAFELARIDFSALQPAEQEAAVAAWWQTEANRAFDLQQGPLFAAYLLQLTPLEHLLVFKGHHIIIDGWSWNLLVQELQTLYTAHDNGTVVSLPSPLPFREYTERQRAQRHNPTMMVHADYWLHQFADGIPVLDLPFDRSRSATNPYQGARQTLRLDAKQVSNLKTFSRQQNCTFFMTLFAAFTTLIHRLTSQNDFVVATAVSGRAEAERTGLIGYCSHLLPIRHQLDPQRPFTEHLAQTRRRLLDGYEHEAYPFAWLLETLHEQPGGHHTALTSIIFNLDQPMVLPSLGAAACQPYAVPQPAQGFDLMVNVMEINQEIILDCDYSTALLDDTTVERWLGHWQILLTAITEQPQMPIRTLPLLTTAEYQQLVYEWNETTVDFGPPQTIHALFEQQVARTPDAVALIMAEDKKTSRQEAALSLPKGDKVNDANDIALSSCYPVTLSYSELNARANQLAHHLIELGVQPDTLVAVMMERSIEMVVSLLAVLKAGGAYVPIDPTYPSERIAYMLTDSAAPILLTQSYLDFAQTTDKAAGQNGRHIIAVDQMGTQLAAYPTSNPHTKTTPAHLAYVIYTSGSTGQPKGVMVQHTNVVAMLHGFEKIAPRQKQLVGTAVCPFSFDVSIWEFFSMLCFGGSLHLLPVDVFADAVSFAEYMAIHSVTSSYIPPALLLGMTEACQQLKTRLSLDRILVGVEPIQQGRLQHFRDLSSGMRIINGYGPTESTICSTFFDFQQATEPERRTPIGKAVTGYKIYLLNELQQPLPIGVAGELYVGGAGLTRGYLNRPELTAERFIEHPKFGRLYKTGDLCRWLPNGNIEYIGRTDFQVKIRGFRIELGEIESALLAQEGVREAVVLAREETAGDKRLVAYVVQDASCKRQGDTSKEQDVSCNLQPATLRSSLQAKLPEYMMPSAFVFLEALPLTPNGKLDRRALPIPDYTDAQHEFVAPRNELETQLVAIWQAVLGGERVAPEQSRRIGVDDNFFALGGHSLLATQVMSRIRQAFVIDLPLRIFFETPTIAELATHIRMSEVAQQLSQTNAKQNKADTTKVEEEW